MPDLTVPFDPQTDSRVGVQTPGSGCISFSVQPPCYALVASGRHADAWLLSGDGQSPGRWTLSLGSVSDLGETLLRPQFSHLYCEELLLGKCCWTPRVRGAKEEASDLSCRGVQNMKQLRHHFPTAPSSLGIKPEAIQEEGT